ncbi:MAG: ion channel [Bacteroidia bacterium]
MNQVVALPILFSLAIIVVTIIIHGVGSAWYLNYMSARHDFKDGIFGFKKSLFILSLTAVFFMLLHYIEIAVWAIVFLTIPELDKLSHWEEAIYFSTVTYTTTGYGDITLPPVWRVMGGFEAMSGILLFGWTAAMFYAVVQKILLRMNNKG